MKETSTKILIPYERFIHLVFRQEEWLVEDDPLYLKFWAKLNPFLQKADFQSIFARSTSAVTYSEKVQLSLIGSLHKLSSEPTINSVRCP